MINDGQEIYEEEMTEEDINVEEEKDDEKYWIYDNYIQIILYTAIYFIIAFYMLNIEYQYKLEVDCI